MSMSVESLLHLKKSTICDTSLRQRQPTITSPHSFSHLGLRAPCAKVMGLVLWCLVVGVVSSPGSWGGTEEKQPLKLPEVVILGQDTSVLKETKERLMPQDLTPTLKEIP